MLIALLQTVELMRDILPQYSIEVNDTLPFEKDPKNAIEQAKVRPVLSSRLSRAGAENYTSNCRTKAHRASLLSVLRLKGSFIASLLGVLRLNSGDAEPFLRHCWVY